MRTEPSTGASTSLDPPPWGRRVARASAGQRAVRSSVVSPVTRLLASATALLLAWSCVVRAQAPVAQGTADGGAATAQAQAQSQATPSQQQSQSTTPAAQAAQQQAQGQQTTGIPPQ